MPLHQIIHKVFWVGDTAGIIPKDGETEELGQGAVGEGTCNPKNRVRLSSSIRNNSFISP